MRYQFHCSRLILLTLTCWYLCSSHSDTAAAELVYNSGSGVRFHVDTNGLNQITVGGRTFATGNWTVFDAQSWFPRASSNGPSIRCKEVQRQKFEILSTNQVVVHLLKDDVAVEFNYLFDGEDVTIRARVENRHHEATVDAVGFSGLALKFDHSPDGLHHAMHSSYSRANGKEICYPSAQNPIGGAFATDSSAGIGLAPLNLGLERTLILLDYESWAPDKREKVPVRRLIYICPTAIPPLSSRSFSLRIRVSSNRDWKHLLGPYKEHFQSILGNLRYRPDSRWIASDYLNHSQRAVSAANPYGFHSGFRRIDTAEGANQFCDRIIADLKPNNGQGIIVWGQGGDDPRGAMYRPDFDVLPPEVEMQWTNVIAPRLRAAGLALGVAARPHDLAVRLDWHHDEAIHINPDDPGHRAMLLRRFQRMIERGCTLFYLDSFGDSLDDVKLMAWLRDQLGPNIRTYCEHQCDAIVPFSGGYSETTLHAEPAEKHPYYQVWSDVRAWEIYRWLCPGAELAARLFEIKGEPPTGFESVDSYYNRNRIIPLVPVNEIEKRGPELRVMKTTAGNGN